jgi:RNA polymerase sigma-70 factor (ECF subfamily)
MKDLERYFSRVYQEHVDALFRYSLFKVSDREVAKDLVQETFVRTWEYLEGRGSIVSMKAFLYRTLSNLIIDEYRKKKAVSIDSLREEGFDVPFDERGRLLDALDGERAILILRKLPEDYREVIFMRYVEELTLEEIAEITGEPKNTLSVRIHRGLQKLRELFPYGKR